MGKNAHTVLIVDYDDEVAETEAAYLADAGYSVTRLNHGDRSISFVRHNSPDLVLLDPMLPGMDGFEICREVRKFSDVPIIIVTARTALVDRLIGLEIGADDYICKPCNPREVVARVKVVLRRFRSAEKRLEDVLNYGRIQLNMNSHETWVDDKPLHLTPSEFSLLRAMLKRPGRVFSRDELIEQVQGQTYQGYDRTIDSHIKNLRKKIRELLPGKEMIISVYGIGYKMHPLVDG